MNHLKNLFNCCDPKSTSATTTSTTPSCFNDDVFFENPGKTKLSPRREFYPHMLQDRQDNGAEIINTVQLQIIEAKEGEENSKNCENEEDNTKEEGQDQNVKDNKEDGHEDKKAEDGHIERHFKENVI